MAIERRRSHPSHDVIVRAVKRIVADISAPVIVDVGILSTVTLGKLVEAHVDTRGYVGVDLSAPIIRNARDRHPKLGWVQGDLERLPFATTSADVVLVRHVLEHIVDVEAGILEIARVTRRAAIICFFLPLAERTSRRTDVYSNGFIHHNTWARAPLERLMRRLFTQVRINLVPDSRRTNQVYILEQPVMAMPESGELR